MPATETFAVGEMPGVGAGEAQTSPMRGVQVDELNGDIRQQLGLRSDVKGVVIIDVPRTRPPVMQAYNAATS